MCTKYTPHQSLQSANQSLDTKLQQNLVDILKTLNTKYELELVIVMSGLTPPALMNETLSLENSYHLWSTKEDKSLFEQITKRYGAQFYAQELANAANLTDNEFFVAPFTASA